MSSENETVNIFNCDNDQCCYSTTFCGNVTNYFKTIQYFQNKITQLQLLKFIWARYLLLFSYVKIVDNCRG